MALISRSLFQLFFLTTTIVAIAFFLSGVDFSDSNTTSNKSKIISKLWAADFKKIKKVLVKNKWMSEIKEVSLIGSDELTQQWVKDGIKSPLQTNPEGYVKLEVLVIHWQETGAEGFILQHTFINQNTGNTIFELGRTYKFTN